VYSNATFDAIFKSAPIVTVLSSRDGWTSWGSTSDINAPNAYAITIRGKFQGNDAQGRDAHNQLVANVPPPGPVAQGNIAHLPMADRDDPTTLVIVEVWNDRTNQERLYSDPQFVAALGKFWAGPPAITRWRTTNWVRW
jgi:quinol monooxygenase YgiN